MTRKQRAPIGVFSRTHKFSRHYRNPCARKLHEIRLMQIPLQHRKRIHKRGRARGCSHPCTKRFVMLEVVPS